MKVQMFLRKSVFVVVAVFNSTPLCQLNHQKTSNSLLVSCYKHFKKFSKPPLARYFLTRKLLCEAFNDVCVGDNGEGLAG